MFLLTTSCTIHYLRALFETDSLPDVIASNGGASFTSAEWEKFFLAKSNLAHTYRPLPLEFQWSSQKYDGKCEGDLLRLTLLTGHSAWRGFRLLCNRELSDRVSQESTDHDNVESTALRSRCSDECPK